MSKASQPERDYYEVLQVAPNATDEVIRAAYKRLAFNWHPDRNPGDPFAVDEMRLLNEAYQALSNPEKRQEYDSHRQHSPKGHAVTGLTRRQKGKFAINVPKKRTGHWFWGDGWQPNREGLLELSSWAGGIGLVLGLAVVLGLLVSKSAAAMRVQGQGASCSSSVQGTKQLGQGKPLASSLVSRTNGFSAPSASVLPLSARQGTRSPDLITSGRLDEKSVAPVLVGERARADEIRLRSTTAISFSSEPRTIPSVSASQNKAIGIDGLSYQTYIPRPTQKGYYEPKIVPYPVGKPVYVQGYYRKNGTYVQPHFRSLPNR